MTLNPQIQRTPFPLVVMLGMDGFYLAHRGGAYLSPVLDPTSLEDCPPPLWFPTMEAAEYARVVAMGAVGV